MGGASITRERERESGNEDKTENMVWECGLNSDVLCSLALFVNTVMNPRFPKIREFFDQEVTIKEITYTVRLNYLHKMVTVCTHF
jgi:hypothetical protein